MSRKNSIRKAGSQIFSAVCLCDRIFSGDYIDMTHSNVLEGQQSHSARPKCVTLSIVCIWGGRSPLLLLMMNNEHISQIKIRNGVTLAYAIVQQVECNDYLAFVWIITAQVYNIVPSGGSTLVCHNFGRLLPAQALWSNTAHVRKLKKSHLLFPLFLS